MNTLTAQKSRQNFAILELVFASTIWGFGFIAVAWALTAFSPIWINFLRYFFASALALPIVFAVPSLRRKWTRSLIMPALIPGATLCVGLVFQTWGLKYTTATKCGFITTLYVIFVPIGVAFFHKRKVGWIHWACVAVALFGTALICDFRAGDWNRGDLLTLLAALAMTAQILLIDRAASDCDSPFLFNIAQNMWGTLVALPFALLIEGWTGALDHFWNFRALAMIGFLAWASSIFAFGIQVHAQKSLSPSTASLLFLLESPFAAVFAYFLLGESQSPEQWLGGALILAAAAIASIYMPRYSHTT